jgi:hypothetical protein
VHGGAAVVTVGGRDFLDRLHVATTG